MPKKNKCLYTDYLIYVPFVIMPLVMFLFIALKTYSYKGVNQSSYKLFSLITGLFLLGIIGLLIYFYFNPGYFSAIR